MAIIRKQELQNITEEHIESKILELSKEMMKLQAQRAVGTAIDNPGKIKEIRRTIARLVTIRESRKKLEGGKKKKV